MRNPFIFAEFAAKTSFPNGSTPGTRNTTSSAIKFSTVAVSPALVAANHFSTRARISCSSFSIIFSPANLQGEGRLVATKLRSHLGLVLCSAGVRACELRHRLGALLKCRYAGFGVQTHF